MLLYAVVCYCVKIKQKELKNECRKKGKKGYSSKME